MSLAKRMLTALETGTTDEKYMSVAQFLAVKYHMSGSEVLRSEIMKYCKKYGLSPKKLGKIISLI